MALRQIFFVVLSVFFVDVVEAQKHDAFSFFGYIIGGSDPKLGRYAIDFTVSPPKIIKQNKKINFSSYCGSCSDSLGKLQFYTNGISIQNKAHQLLQNGDSINAISDTWKTYKELGYPLGKGCMALPLPKQKNQYILLHQAYHLVPLPSGEYIAHLPLLSTKIDMQQNGGNGKVIEKNKWLLDEQLIPFAITKHGNGRDWWIITAKQTTTQHYIFQITSEGASLAYIQEYGPAFPDRESQSFSNISPDGRTYVRHDGKNGLRVYDFDRCSGQLSNLRIFPYQNGFTTVEVAFSADSRFLFLSSYAALMVMDMLAPDPPLTSDTLAYYDGLATPLPFQTTYWTGQLHEDGKIYYATTNSTLALHVIHQPELLGLAANVQQHGITLPVYNDGTMCQFPNYRLGRWAGSPCDTLPFAGPVEENFQHHPYEAKRGPDTLTWRVLSPLRGKGGPEHDWPDVQTMLLQKGPEWRKKE